MHEYSIVQALINSCEEHAVANNATKITKVVVKIGKLSGVEPDLLQTAFDTFKEKTMCENAQMQLNIQPVVIQCNTCGVESILEDLQYCCKNCQSIDVKVLDGEDMYLMQLECE